MNPEFNKKVGNKTSKIAAVSAALLHLISPDVSLAKNKKQVTQEQQSFKVLPNEFDITEEMKNRVKPEDWQSGQYVLVENIMNYKVPSEYLRKVEDLATKYGTVVVISKTYKRHWLFSNGKLINEGPAGTAMKYGSYETESGEYPVGRKENDNYRSNELTGTDGRGAFMGNAVFFDEEKGKALHESVNYTLKLDLKSGEYKEVLLVDSSHGCVNLNKNDAKIVNQNLKSKKDTIVILD